MKCTLWFACEVFYGRCFSPIYLIHRSCVNSIDPEGECAASAAFEDAISQTPLEQSISTQLTSVQLASAQDGDRKIDSEGFHICNVADLKMLSLYHPWSSLARSSLSQPSPIQHRYPPRS